MVRNKKRYLVFINRVLAMVLAALGFTSCENEQPTEYGVPHARYEMKGKVLDANGEVVSGMGVIATEHYPMPASVLENREEEIVYTDVNGEFIVIQESSYNRFRMYFLDKGETAHSYERVDSVDVDFKDIPLEGASKSWYKGKATQNLEVVLNQQ